MTDKTFTFPEDLIQKATELVIRENSGSVSLLQRHFRLGYTDGLALAKALEESGIITPPQADGHRILTPRAAATREERNAPP